MGKFFNPKISEKEKKKMKAVKLPHVKPRRVIESEVREYMEKGEPSVQ